MYKRVKSLDFLKHRCDTIKSLIGIGEYGRIYRTVWIKHGINYEYSMKEIGPFEKNNMLNDVFVREYKIMRSLFHENIVEFIINEFYDEEHYDGTSSRYGRIYMKCYNPENLQSKLCKGGLVMTNEEKLIILIQISSAMGHIHKKKIVYFDLKPQNIIFDEFGNVKICDFGSSFSLKDLNKRNGHVFGGSAFYISPEVINGTYNIKNPYPLDVYSFGILMWRMWSEEEPYSTVDKGKYSILSDIYNNDKRPDIKKIYNKIPFYVESSTLIKSCWDKNPDIRLTFLEINEVLESMLKRLLITKHNSIDKRVFLEYPRKIDENNNFIINRKRTHIKRNIVLKTILTDVIPKAFVNCFNSNNKE